MSRCCIDNLGNKRPLIVDEISNLAFAYGVVVPIPTDAEVFANVIFLKPKTKIKKTMVFRVKRIIEQ